VWGWTAKYCNALLEGSAHARNIEFKKCHAVVENLMFSDSNVGSGPWGHFTMPLLILRVSTIFFLKSRYSRSGGDITISVPSSKTTSSRTKDIVKNTWGLTFPCNPSLLRGSLLWFLLSKKNHAAACALGRSTCSLFLHEGLQRWHRGPGK
jgi:hypothetical protein